MDEAIQDSTAGDSAMLLGHCFCCRAGSKSIPKDFLLGLHASMHPEPASMVLGIFHRFNDHGSMMFTQSKMFLEGATYWKPFLLSQPVNDI